MAELNEFEGIFVEECKYWIKFFGLLNWDIEFNFDYEDEDDGACTWTCHSAAATIALCGGCTPDDYYVRRTAFHEVLHIFLGATQDLLSNVYSSLVTETAIHNIIRILENSVFNENYKQRFKKRKNKNE